MAKSRIKVNSLRLAAPADANAITALLEASYTTLFAADYATDLLGRALPLMTRANATLLATGAFYVVEGPGGLLVGCGGWSKELPGTGAVSPGLAHIRHFATHPDWLRKGIASRILERCLADAKLQGTERFLCFSSLSAAEFYRSKGFQTLQRLDLRLTADVAFPAVIMERRLVAGLD